MTTRVRVILASSIMLLAASATLVACVGDDPTAANTPIDASTPTDGSSTTDTGIADTGSTTTSDASDAGIAETFDGSNQACNGLFPQDAPMPATIECDGGPITAGGGAIQPGRYYLVDQKNDLGCPGGAVPYSDVIEISAGDGGFTVNAALNGKIDSRLTLAWVVSGNTFTQYDVCPSDSLHPAGIGYSAVGNSLTYFLPGFGNLTYQQF